MSYDIIYKKQFIKLSDDKFVPMILSGCNNCTEFVNGRERRERSWYPHNYMVNGNLYGTLDEMLEVAKKINSHYKENETEYTEDRFGYYEALQIGSGSTHKTTFNNFLNIFKDGCKKAKTVEELKSLGINVRVMNGYIPYDSNIISKEIYVNSTDELLNAIKELREFYKGTNINVTVSYGNSTDYVNKMLKTNRIINYAKRNEKAELIRNAKETFHIKLNNGGHLVKLTKHGYRYVWYTGYPCKRFLTEKQANTYLNKVKNRLTGAQVVKITT